MVGLKVSWYPSNLKGTSRSSFRVFLVTMLMGDCFSPAQASLAWFHFSGADRSEISQWDGSEQGVRGQHVQTLNKHSSIWTLSVAASLQGLSWPLITRRWDIYCTCWLLPRSRLLSQPNHVLALAKTCLPSLLPGQTSPTLLPCYLCFFIQTPLNTRNLTIDNLSTDVITHLNFLQGTRHCTCIHWFFSHLLVMFTCLGANW